MPLMSDVHVFCDMCILQDQPTKPLMPLMSDMDKIKTTLKQFVRDWSDAGRPEREVCYNPVLEEIKSRFPPDKW